MSKRMHIYVDAIGPIRARFNCSAREAGEKVGELIAQNAKLSYDLGVALKRIVEQKMEIDSLKLALSPKATETTAELAAG